MTRQPDTDLQENNNNHQSTSEKLVKTNSVRESWALPKRAGQILNRPRLLNKANPYSLIRLLVLALVLMGISLTLKLPWIGISSAIFLLLLSLRVILPGLKTWILTYLTSSERRSLLGVICFLLAILGLLKYTGVNGPISRWLAQVQWDRVGSWAEWIGAIGQILIAILAVYVAWAQYVISRDLTIQQNKITQQQTIDSYFQGISDLVLNDQGLLEDWPPQRAIAEGRTSAIFGDINASGKAKVIRFLSSSRLVIPLKRDTQLGRPIFDGVGSYTEDRVRGIRVISLGVMLAGADLAGQDLRWTDLSEANMVRANLSNTDLVKANLSRTVFYEADLSGANLKGAILFYGFLKTASPRSRKYLPDYETGAYTGVVVEKADLTNVQNLSPEQRFYFCAWGGSLTRKTIPGGCENIPNLLNR